MATEQHTIESLVFAIRETNTFFQNQAQKQVNVALTLRNWAIGYYLVEYEQNGSDKAIYGEQLFKNISKRLTDSGIRGLSFTTLHTCKQFYTTYPQIVQTLSEQFPLNKYLIENDYHNKILQTLSEEFELKKTTSISDGWSGDNCDNLHLEQFKTKPEILINRLSFSHFIELLKADTEIKRMFYEVEALKNNWSVRELQRAMNSMLYERTGLSTGKQGVIKKQRKEDDIKAVDIFRNPYILEFLGFEERFEYTEIDLEQAIINHLQSFLLELGRGFCFEARQKRITFDNKHYRIDLVFYHRILKCHVLIDLKLGEFDHADAGQMNVYLNYYKENEIAGGDNAPIGIILCANKNENLVRYATAGLPQQVFVSNYMVNLPSEAELKKIIEEEQQKLKQ